MFTPAVTCAVEAVPCEAAFTCTNETSDVVRTSSVWTATAVVSETLVDI
jgi:hypothetical protein